MAMADKTLIIAEAGVNHNGDMETARRLVDAAAQAGADIVKFQTFKADRLVTVSANKAGYQMRTTGAGESQHEMIRKLELSEAMHDELIAHCAKRGIEFFSTAFDLESLDYLMGLGMRRVKVPSGEITNLPYLRRIGGFGKSVILSTGMSTLDDIEAALDVLERSGTARELVTVLHCNTEYPVPMDEVNLRAMQTIASTFHVAVGFSDHTQGIEVATAAVSSKSISRLIATWRALTTGPAWSRRNLRQWCERSATSRRQWGMASSAPGPARRKMRQWRGNP